jgi:predicted nucleic-acid-binding protein
VLESGYRLSKEMVVQALENLEVNQAFALENEDLCHRALALFRSSKARLFGLRDSLRLPHQGLDPPHLR